MNVAIEYSGLPAVLRGGMQRFIELRLRPGDFLFAVLSDSLTKAVFAADAENLARLPEIARWVYNEAPPMCWGSEEKVRAWIAGGP